MSELQQILRRSVAGCLLICISGIGPMACVSVECDGADVFCDPFALILYRLAVEPDCLVRGETPATGWLSFSGSSGEDEFATSICGMRDGTVLLAGQANDVNPTTQGIAPLIPFTGAPTDTNVVIYQVDGAGSLKRWSHFGAAGVQLLGVKVAEAPDGFFAVASASAGFQIQGLSPRVAHQGGTSDIAVMRFDANLNLLWFTFIGSSGNEVPADIVPTGDGGLMILGRTSAAHSIQGVSPLQPYLGGIEVVLYYLNSTGSVDWFSFFGTAGNDTPTAISRVPLEPILVGQSAGFDQFVFASIIAQDIPEYAGQTPIRAYSGGSDIAIARVDRSGLISQYGFYGTAASETISSLCVARSGDIYLGGGSSANIAVFDGLAPLTPYSGNADGWLVRLNAAGSVRSHRFLGSSIVDTIQGLSESPGGDLLVGMSLGATATLGITPAYANSGVRDGALIRIDPNDTIQAFAYYGGTAAESILSFAPTADGGAVLGGEAPSPAFSAPSGVPILEAYAGSSDEFYLRVFADGRTIR
ncbi:MAG: hypothetical protein RIF32_01885 [Leptospirales bacterium]